MAIYKVMILFVMGFSYGVFVTMSPPTWQVIIITASLSFCLFGACADAQDNWQKGHHKETKP